MASFTQKQIEQALDAKSARLGPQDLARIAKAKDAVMKMIDEFPPSWAKAQRQATLLFELIEANVNGKLNASADELKYAAGALIYLGEPLDLVPDDEDDGYADDAAIVGLGVARTVTHVRAYCQANGKNAAEYID